LRKEGVETMRFKALSVLAVLSLLGVALIIAGITAA